MTDLHGWITQQIERVDKLAREQEHSLWQLALGDDSVAALVLRRSAADRKILDGHNTFDDGSVYCVGCGVDYESGPIVDNVNDCPTLLALAEGYGLTPEILATLDRPQRPEPKRRGGILPPGIGATADVPPALRGPNWKARP
ncbi:MAG TPA: hypothetical protein VIP28_10635 [Nocardioides sp.]